MSSQKPGPFDPLLTDAAHPPTPDRAAVYVIGTIIGWRCCCWCSCCRRCRYSAAAAATAQAASSEPGTASTYTSTVRSGIPKLPAGLVAASALFDLAAPQDKRGGSRLTVPLKDKQTDTRSLALYTYVDSGWQRFRMRRSWPAARRREGEVSALPGNIAVLRRTKASLQVAGILPAGTTVDKNGATVLTTVHPLTFIPVATGDIAGQPPAVPPASYTVVPGVVAPDAETVNALLRASDARAHHAAAIADAVKQGNYAGIDIDYRSVSPTLKEQFSQFVDQLAQALHADHRTLTLTLPMPAEQNGSIDPGAYDWQKLGQSADSIEIAGELDQELYFQHTEAALATSRQGGPKQGAPDHQLTQRRARRRRPAHDAADRRADDRQPGRHRRRKRRRAVGPGEAHGAEPRRERRLQRHALGRQCARRHLQLPGPRWQAHGVAREPVQCRRSGWTSRSASASAALSSTMPRPKVAAPTSGRRSRRRRTAVRSRSTKPNGCAPDAGWQTGQTAR